MTGIRSLVTTVTILCAVGSSTSDRWSIDLKPAGRVLRTSDGKRFAPYWIGIKNTTSGARALCEDSLSYQVDNGEDRLIAGSVWTQWVHRCVQEAGKHLVLAGETHYWRVLLPVEEYRGNTKMTLSLRVVELDAFDGRDQPGEFVNLKTEQTVDLPTSP